MSAVEHLLQLCCGQLANISLGWEVIALEVVERFIPRQCFLIHEAEGAIERNDLVVPRRPVLCLQLSQEFSPIVFGTLAQTFNHFLRLDHLLLIQCVHIDGGQAFLDRVDESGQAGNDVRVLFVFDSQIGLDFPSDDWFRDHYVVDVNRIVLYAHH